MTSIRHFPATHPLPDWRNFGVMLRVLLGVNVLALLAALLQVPDLLAWPGRYVELAALVEPWLLICLGLLSLLRDALWRLPLRLGQGLVLALAGGLAFGLYTYWQSLLPVDTASPWRAAVLATVAVAILLGYFELRAGASRVVWGRLDEFDRYRPHAGRLLG